MNSILFFNHAEFYIYQISLDSFSVRDFMINNITFINAHEFIDQMLWKK